MDNKVLAIVPARGGSKSIERKNVVQVCGLPLIAYTLNALRGIRHDIDHIVSTEDEEIKEVAVRYGGNVPYLRPIELARDETNIIDVIDDVLMKAGREYEYVMLLQPTAPLRSSEDIDAALELADTHGARSVCGFMKVDSFHPWYMYYLEEGKKIRQVVETKPGMRRQEFPEALWRNGAIYLFRVDMYRAERKFISDDCVPYIMPAERSINIDGPEDLKLAEYYLQDQVAKIKEQKYNFKIKNR